MIKRDDSGRVDFGKGELFIQILIVISLVEFCFETLPNLSQGVLNFLHILETLIVILFTAEYFIRVIWCRPRGKYALSFMGIVDLVAILPFYLALGLDLKSIRAFRLLRLFRLLKLVRFTKAIDRYVVAFKSIREELTLFGVTSLITIYVASVGIYYFENAAQPDVFSSVFDAMWWSIVTLTTVGYGDAYPITLGGKLFTSVVLLIGLGIVAVPTGLFAAALAKTKNK